MFRVGDVIYGGHRGEYNENHYTWDFEQVIELSSEIQFIKNLPKDHCVSYNRTYIT